MHAKDLFVNDSSNGEAVKAIGESFPQLDVVSSFALVIEPINSIDGCAFVVTSEEEEVLWVLDFVSE